MRRLREAIRQKRTELWKNQSWNLYNDKAPAHLLMFVREFSAKNKIVIMPQPLYSSDLGPRWLFPLPRTEDTDERQAFCCDWEDKRKNETGAVGDTKELVSEVFRELEKMLVYVHYEFLPQGRTVTKEYHVEVMRWLREAIRQKRTELWKRQSWILHYDKAPAHLLMIMCEFLAKNKTVIMPHPPYWPDLAPLDFFLFPKLTAAMKGMLFATIEKIKEKSKRELLAIPKIAFQKGFEDWKKCWHKCIISEGSYFEGG